MEAVFAVDGRVDFGEEGAFGSTGEGSGVGWIGVTRCIGGGGAVGVEEGRSALEEGGDKRWPERPDTPGQLTPKPLDFTPPFSYSAPSERRLQV